VSDDSGSVGGGVDGLSRERSRFIGRGRSEASVMSWEGLDSFMGVVPAGRLRLVVDSSWAGGDVKVVGGAFGSGKDAAGIGFGGGGRL
jgi:hypothetical protein